MPVAYLFKVEIEGFFDRNNWYYLQNLICYNHFLLYNKQKLLGVYIFLKIASIAKQKSAVKSDQYREAEQLAVFSCYQILLYEKT